jgi:4-diphosphocytidyl-2C-methyl-D-erythritol kinase
MSEIEKARKISELVKEIDHINTKIEFASTAYKDEFYLAKSQTDKFSEYTSNVRILPSDLNILIRAWNERLEMAEKQLKEELK